MSASGKAQLNDTRRDTPTRSRSVGMAFGEFPSGLVAKSGRPPSVTLGLRFANGTFGLEAFVEVARIAWNCLHAAGRWRIGRTVTLGIGYIVDP
jgi:hypothetical protein